MKPLHERLADMGIRFRWLYQIKDPLAESTNLVVVQLADLELLERRAASSGGVTDDFTSLGEPQTPLQRALLESAKRASITLNAEQCPEPCGYCDHGASRTLSAGCASPNPTEK